MPSDEDQGQLSQARKIVIGDCMKGFGFKWIPAPELPKVGPKTLTDWRYGIHDMALAKERGYKADAEEQAAYDAAVDQGAVDVTTADGPDARALDGRIKEVDGKKVPKDGCVGEALCGSIPACAGSSLPDLALYGASAKKSATSKNSDIRPIWE